MKHAFGLLLRVRDLFKSYFKRPQLAPDFSLSFLALDMEIFSDD
jgi:hypothetical protein